MCVLYCYEHVFCFVICYDGAFYRYILYILIIYDMGFYDIAGLMQWSGRWVGSYLRKLTCSPYSGFNGSMDGRQRSQLSGLFSVVIWMLGLSPVF